MDYRTKPTSRKALRQYSSLFRKIFNVKQTGSFPVIEALERIPDIFKNCGYIVVEDDELPPQTMAQCIMNEEDGFTIEIKESVYKGAYENGTGALRGFICHEICHIFLFKIGFTPVFEMSVGNEKVPAYCSVEWQAKALCAEVMIPYEESKGMTTKQIISTYGVSDAFARRRRKLEGK